MFHAQYLMQMEQLQRRLNNYYLFKEVVVAGQYVTFVLSVN